MNLNLEGWIKRAERAEYSEQQLQAEVATLRLRCAELERERDRFGEYVDFFKESDAENKQLEARVKQMEEALRGVMRGDCWCEMAVGNPMVKNHAPQCRAARAALSSPDFAASQFRFIIEPSIEAPEV